MANPTTTNTAPTVSKEVAAQTATEGKAYKLVAKGIFTDGDKGDSLSITTSELPSWLEFDAKKGFLTGKPGFDTSGETSVTLTATDKAGLTATTTFTITIADTAKANGTGKADTIQGGAGNDTITGQGGHDVINGGADDDMLIGGTGNDTLTGGTGADTFVFSSAPSKSNIDQITDFVSGTDKLSLSGKLVAKLKGDTDLSDNLVIGSAAVDADDRLIFDSATNTLSYDADGSGKGKAIVVCTLVGVTTLAATDFIIPAS